jgi:hypothetical protein
VIQLHGLRVELDDCCARKSGDGTDVFVMLASTTDLRFAWITTRPARGEDDWGLSGDSEVVLNRRRRKLWSWDKVERVVKPFCG